MDVGLVLILILLVIIVLLLILRSRRRQREGYPAWFGGRLSSALGERAASAYLDYLPLRVRVIVDPGAAAEQSFGSAAEAIVAELGPAFDARRSAWSRLGSLEPNLRAFVTQDIDPSFEEPMDLETFADRILLVRRAQPRLITPEEWFTFAASMCVMLAAEWRMPSATRIPDDATSPRKVARGAP